MNRLMLISTLFLGTALYGQSGTIKVRKEKTEMEKFMRETPRISIIRQCILKCGCPPKPNPIRHTFIMTGAGYQNGWYGELGIEQITFKHYARFGVLGQIHQEKGVRMRLYGQVDLIQYRGNQLASLGLSGDFALNRQHKNAVQPYIGFRIPAWRLYRFQMNVGYSLPYGKKEELKESNNVLTVGLWCRL